MKKAELENIFFCRNPQKQILFEKCKGPLLVICGAEDRLSLQCSKHAVDRAKQFGCTNLTMIEYPETGHLIDLPHSPHVKEATHPLLPVNRKVQYGGKSQPHALAQFHAWDTLLNFFRGNM